MLHIFIVTYLIVRVFGINPNIRSEPNGITWSLAASTCGENGLESDEDIIKRSNFPVNLTFWIGKPTYSGTDWKKLGCYNIHPIDTQIFVPYNLTSCKIKCGSKKYLAHKPKEHKCLCLGYWSPDKDGGTSQCESSNFFYVYKDDMHLPLSCFSGMIHYHFGHPELDKDTRDCNNPLNRYLCKSSDEHVSSTNANGMKFTENFLSTKMHDESPNRPQHNSLIDAFNSVSQTTVVAHTKTTEKKEEEVHNEVNKFPFGAIVGGGLSVVVVIVLMLVLVVCKIRSCGIFKAPKIEQDDVFSSNATNDDSNITADFNSVITSNQTYGIANSNESNSNAYSSVNKIKTPCSSLMANDDIYTDTSYGEYDRLNEVHMRKILTTHNLYESNEGTRNEIDPTYNSSDVCERKTNNHDRDMDMYSIMSTNSGGYNLNLK